LFGGVGVADLRADPWLFYMLITSNLAFSEWGQVFQGERMTATLLDRLTHHCHIFEMNGESYRFKQSVGKSKNKKKKK